MHRPLRCVIKLGQHRRLVLAPYILVSVGRILAHFTSLKVRDLIGGIVIALFLGILISEPFMDVVADVGIPVAFVRVLIFQYLVEVSSSFGKGGRIMSEEKGLKKKIGDTVRDVGKAVTTATGTAAGGGI